MRVSIFDDMSQCTESDVARLLPVVNQQRREQALRYKHLFGQWACLKSWEMLGIDKEWQYNEYGKPFIAGGPEFSISHCKNGIAVATDTQPIGIDIESIRHADEALVARTMNDEERKRIHSDADFIRLWTRKEAYLKYLGTGIIDDLHHVLDDTKCVLFETIETERYIYTICYEKV